jgi:hypothetical protein
VKLYLDDVRETPAGWTGVKTAAEMIRLLESAEVDEVSLDHDLGPEDSGDGYEVLIWIERQVATRAWVPPVIHVHTANPAARLRMEAALRSIERLSAR